MTAQITMQCRQGRDQTGPFPGFGILEHTRFFLGVNLIFFDNPKIFTKHLNTTTTTAYLAQKRMADDDACTKKPSRSL